MQIKKIDVSKKSLKDMDISCESIEKKMFSITIKKLNQMNTTKELIESTNIIRHENFEYAFNNRTLIEEGWIKTKELETVAYQLALELATTPEELEACALSIENDSTGYDDPDGLAEQIRIKAYGIEWYLKKEFNSSAYQEFLHFANETGFENPLEELEN